MHCLQRAISPQTEAVLLLGQPQLGVKIIKNRGNLVNSYENRGSR